MAPPNRQLEFALEMEYTVAYDAFYPTKSSLAPTAHWPPACSISNHITADLHSAGFSGTTAIPWISTSPLPPPSGGDTVYAQMKLQTPFLPLTQLSTWTQITCTLTHLQHPKAHYKARPIDGTELTVRIFFPPSHHIGRFALIAMIFEEALARVHSAEDHEVTVFLWAGGRSLGPHPGGLVANYFKYADKLWGTMRSDITIGEGIRSCIGLKKGRVAITHPVKPADLVQVLNPSWYKTEVEELEAEMEQEGGIDLRGLVGPTGLGRRRREEAFRHGRFNEDILRCEGEGLMTWVKLCAGLVVLAERYKKEDVEALMGVYVDAEKAYDSSWKGRYARTELAEKMFHVLLADLLRHKIIDTKTKTWALDQMAKHRESHEDVLSLVQIELEKPAEWEDVERRVEVVKDRYAGRIGGRYAWERERDRRLLMEFANIVGEARLEGKRFGGGDGKGAASC